MARKGQNAFIRVNVRRLFEYVGSNMVTQATNGVVLVGGGIPPICFDSVVSLTGAAEFSHMWHKSLVRMHPVKILVPRFAPPSSGKSGILEVPP